MEGISSVVEFQSVTVPGVTITLYVVTERRRRDLQTKQAELRKRFRSLSAAKEKLFEPAKDDPANLVVSPDNIEKLGEIAEEMQLVDQQLTDNWLTWGLNKVEGLTIDGVDKGKDDILDFPETLRNEIRARIESESKLSEEEIKNLGLRTTSTPQADGGSKPSTAKSVSEGGSSLRETATPDTVN